MKNIVIVFFIAALASSIFIIPTQPAKAALWFFREEVRDCVNPDGHVGTKVTCFFDHAEECTSQDCDDPTCNPPECGGGSGGGTECDENCPTCGLDCDPYGM